MASFYAELQLEGNSYRVVHCSYACRQATDARGRAQAKVRHAPLELVLDVPTNDVLLSWANTPHKPLAGEVIFYDTAQQAAHETIAFAAGECVQYAERFASSTTGDGAYVCQLTITAPSFELRAGGPAGEVALAAALISQALPTVEKIYENPLADGATSPSIKRVIAPFVLSPLLTQMLGTTIQVASSAGASGPENFTAAVHADLQAIYDTPTGRQLLESLHSSGKRIAIHYAETNSIEFSKALWTRMFYAEDGVTPGAGLGIVVNYNPTLEDAGNLPWNKRSPGIGLAHELIHAEQAAYGRMRRDDTVNQGGLDSSNPGKQMVVPNYELEAIGVHSVYSYPFNENQIRAEWNPPQEKRDYY